MCGDLARRVNWVIGHWTLGRWHFEKAWRTLDSVVHVSVFNSSAGLELDTLCLSI